MLKYYSLLIGENPANTAKFQPSGKRKIVLYANILLIPVLLWFFNGFMLVYEVLQGPLWMALITGLTTATIIFIIERSIIMSNGSKVIMVFRLCLGFLVALLGSICMDEVIFKNDIDLKVAEYQKEVILKATTVSSNNYDDRIKELENNIIIKRNSWVQAMNNASGECDGTTGSKIPKRGPICEMKMGIANKLQLDYDHDVAVMADLRTKSEAGLVAAKDEAITNFNDKGFLIRIRALFDLIANDVILRITYIAFTLFIFLLEFLVVLIKMFSHDSIDEKLEKVRDRVLEMKMNDIQQRTSVHLTPHQILDRVYQANEILKEHSGNMYN